MVSYRVAFEESRGSRTASLVNSSANTTEGAQALGTYGPMDPT